MAAALVWGWRPTTWAILVFNVLGLTLFYVSMFADAQGLPDCGNLAAAERDACELRLSAQARHSLLGSVVMGFWIGGNAILGAVRLAASRKGKRRPAWKVAVRALVGVGLLVVGIWFAAGSVFYYMDTSQIVSTLGRLEDHLADYSSGAEQASGSDGYIRGGVVPVVVSRSGPGEATINGRLWQNLPKGLRAAGPEEAGTVVRTECDYSVSSYVIPVFSSGPGPHSGAHFHQCRCEVKVVDLSLSTIADPGRVFEGEEPPETMREGSDIYGGCPWDDIVEYLTAAPRR